MNKCRFSKLPIGELMELRDILKELQRALPWHDDSRAIYSKLTDYIYKLDVYIANKMEDVENV